MYQILLSLPFFALAEDVSASKVLLLQDDDVARSQDRNVGLLIFSIVGLGIGWREARQYYRVWICRKLIWWFVSRLRLAVWNRI